MMERREEEMAKNQAVQREGRERYDRWRRNTEWRELKRKGREKRAVTEGTLLSLPSFVNIPDYIEFLS